MYSVHDRVIVDNMSEFYKQHTTKNETGENEENKHNKHTTKHFFKPVLPQDPLPCWLMLS